ncbi:AbrB/MazE/SpoVT family DNA-binding domain-containing protein [Halorhabdus amylolytica]|uniref:AbrB/MazE/SpoVT family DNA-binding domain-containing protein n=1 Tax=Halorhabdus amylolytica TaxID=2559573 RepID=UPI0010AA0625|nr:AbrB/MazE/SpoVT family DNA-binding domain-containing protein [Halorhabdus amylolytica]
MSSTEDSPAEEYGSVEINDRGRLTIPKELREALQIDAGTEFTVVREGGDIRLVRDLPELQTLTAGKSDEEWAEDAFRDAGEATFGGR